MLLSATPASDGSRYLTYQSRLTLVHAFVTSRIDCCCYLLTGLPLGTCTLARLDRVLRSAACLVGGGGCPSFLPSLPTCVMFYIGSLFLSVSLQWSPGLSFAAPPLNLATSAVQCRFWQHVGCCVLQRGVSFGPSGTFIYYAAKGLFACGSIRMEISSL